MTRNGTVFCEDISAMDRLVDVAKVADGISATDPAVDAAKDAPAIPSTDIALAGRFPFEGRFACDIAEFLPIEQMRDELTLVTLLLRFEQRKKNLHGRRRWSRSSDESCR
jgi:hypothetical protein